MELEEQFTELWNSGTKYSEIMETLNIASNQVAYLRKKLNLNSRRDLDAQLALREEVFEMVKKRIPVKTIVEEKNVTVMYVRQTIYKKGYSIRDFYDEPIRTREVVKQEPKEGVKCTQRVMNNCIYGSYDCCMYIIYENKKRPCSAQDCTCYKKRPKGFKQRSFV